MTALLDIYTVAFFGHREIEQFHEVGKALEKLVSDLLLKYEYVEFLVGRNGDFDQMVSSTVRSVRNRLGFLNSSLTLVLPYMTAEFRDNEESFLAYYDEVEVSAAADGVHFKSAMQTRNREMVDRSDMVVFCVDHPSGGAYQTLKYVKKHQKPYINISEKGTGLGL